MTEAMGVSAALVPKVILRAAGGLKLAIKMCFWGITEMEYRRVDKKMMKGEWGGGAGEKIKVLLRPGWGQSVPGGMQGALSRSSHLNYKRTLWRHPTSQMRSLGSEEQN